MHRTLLLTAVAAASLIAAPSLADKSYRMKFEGSDLTVRRVDRQPMPSIAEPPAPNFPPPSQALRVGGAKDSAQALRALEAFCGRAAGEFRDFGAYGDPLWRDPKTGDWVVWFDCEPQLGRV